MPTFVEESQRINVEVKKIREIVLNEWRKTVIGRLLIKVLRWK